MQNQVSGCKPYPALHRRVLCQDRNAAAHDLRAAGERGIAIDAAKVEIKSVSDALGLEELIASGRMAVDSVVAVIGKTEGNGGTKCVSPWGPR